MPTEEHLLPTNPGTFARALRECSSPLAAPSTPVSLATRSRPLHSSLVPRRILLGLAGLVLLTLPITCKVYPDSLLDPFPTKDPPPSETELGTGKGFWSGQGDGDCFSAMQPTKDLRPEPSDDEDLPPFFLGIDRLWLGNQRLDGTKDNNAWEDFGFDLDNTCTASPTCDPERYISSCKRTQAGTVPDGNLCRDNNFGKLQFLVSGSADVGGRYGLNDGFFNCGLCYGKYNILIRVTGYNGTKNDDNVRVDLYRSPGLETEIPLTECKAGLEPPICWWVSNAPWTIDRNGTADPTSQVFPDAKIFDAHAFVRDGYLIAFLPPKSLLWFPGHFLDTTTFPLQLTNGIVSARISRANDGTFQLTDGVIGGRVTEQDILLGFRQVGLCEGEPLVDVAKTAVHSNLDVTADPNAPPDTPCDSISLGLVFSARQANAGSLVDGPELVECPPPPNAGAGGTGG